MIGLNHMCFGYNIHIGQKPLSEEQFKKVAEYRGPEDAKLCVELGCLPSPYLQYYYHTSKRVKELQEKELSRAQEVLLVEKEVYADYSNPECCTKPQSILKRGGGGYSEIAIGFIDAVWNNRDTWMVVNVPNNGTVEWLPDDAVIETGCMVNASGINALNMAPSPKAVRGLICAVKNYEQLAIEAAVTGSVETAELALLAHPLVKDCLLYTSGNHQIVNQSVAGKKSLYNECDGDKRNKRRQNHNCLGNTGKILSSAFIQSNRQCYITKSSRGGKKQEVADGVSQHAPRSRGRHEQKAKVVQPAPVTIKNSLCVAVVFKRKRKTKHRHVVKQDN